MGHKLTDTTITDSTGKQTRKCEATWGFDTSTLARMVMRQLAHELGHIWHTHDLGFRHYPPSPDGHTAIHIDLGDQSIIMRYERPPDNPTWDENWPTLQMMVANAEERWAPLAAELHWIYLKAEAKVDKLATRIVKLQERLQHLEEIA
jgi:hypothetical protein